MPAAAAAGSPTIPEEESSRTAVAAEAQPAGEPSTDRAHVGASFHVRDKNLERVRALGAPPRGL